jgi:opacity protein-like surface antigen
VISASALPLLAGAPSAAYAQCLSTLNAATSVISTINTAFLPGGSAFLATAPYSGPGQQGSGVWTRGVGGVVDTQSDTNFNASLIVTSPKGSPLPPSFPASVQASCRGREKQEFAGFEVGHDIAYNADWHFGVLAGYVGAKADAANGVAQTATFAAPSAGLYGAYSKGNFSADVQARLYDIQFESLGQRLDAHGFSLTANAGYRFDLPGNWSLEPSVGGIFSRTSINPLYAGDFTAAGVPLQAPAPLASPATSAVARGTLQVQDVESMLGRASLKLGTSLPLAGGQIVAYPFLTASVFHEFEGNVNAAITTSGKFFTPSGEFNFQGAGTVTASGVGTYGQFGAGSAFQLANTGWLGFARFDYRTGENIQGYSLSAGLRYQLEADRAHDPRMPLKARPAEGYDWTGPYAGISVGRTRGHTQWSQGGSVDPDYAGVLAGGQVGYNFQRGKFVWGIEGDAAYSNASGAKPCAADPVNYSCETDVRTLGSLTGRFGYTWGRALFYAKGGWAFGEVAAGTSSNSVNPALGLPVAAPGVKSTNWENGGTVGAGMEFAFTDRWSAKAEYMHYWFPQYAFAVGQGTTANATTEGDIVRIGVNYHFRP